MSRSFNEISFTFSKRRQIILSATLLMLGGLMYVLFRPNESIFFNWFSVVGVEEQLNAIRERSVLSSSFLPEWLVFSLPNGMWAYAYALLIFSIWKGSNSFVRYFWFATIPVLIFGAEFLQLFTILPGTFCLTDITMGATGLTLGYITNKGLG